MAILQITVNYSLRLEHWPGQFCYNVQVVRSHYIPMCKPNHLKSMQYNANYHIPTVIIIKTMKMKIEGKIVYYTLVCPQTFSQLVMHKVYPAASDTIFGVDFVVR